MSKGTRDTCVGPGCRDPRPHQNHIEVEQIEEGRRREETETEGSFISYVDVDGNQHLGLDAIVASAREGYKSVEQVWDDLFGEGLGFSVYIAGPMSGVDEFNYPAFQEAADNLRALGLRVVNPAENHGGRTDLSLEDYFAADLPQICRTDAVVVLPGWQQSRGAQIEVSLAEHLGHPVLDVNTLQPIHETTLEEAQRLVYGNRGNNYGHPFDDFSRTGRMWGAILDKWRDSMEDDVPPELVGLCMAAVKISREVNSPKRDNRVDLAGYAETIDMIRQRYAEFYDDAV